MSTGQSLRAPDLFPNLVLRHTAGALNDLDGMSWPSLCTAAQRIGTLGVRSQEARDCLGQALYTSIGQLPKGPERYNLLAVRRRIHQRKQLRDDQLQMLRAYPSLATIWEDVREVERRRNQAVQRFRRMYAEALQESLLNIRRIAHGVEFRKALVMASPDLVEALDRDGDDGVRMESLTESLARYVYRARAKVSPFSGFTILGSCIPVSNGLPNPRLRQSSDAVRQVAVNGFLQTAIWQWAALSKTVRDEIPCKLNPTLREHGCRWRWYTNSENRESVRILTPPAWLRRLRELVSEAEAFTLAQARSLVVSASSAPPADAEEALAVLLVNGFLIFDYPAGSRDNEWIDITESWFRELSVRKPAAKPMANLLASLSADSARLPAADASERLALLTSAERRVGDLLGRTASSKSLDPPPKRRRNPPTGGPNVERKRFSRRFLFYEDVMGGMTLRMSRDVLERLCADLETLARGCSLLDPLTIQRRALLRFVQARFGCESEVPFLDVLDEVLAERRRMADAVTDSRAWAFLPDEALISEQSHQVEAWADSIAESCVNRGLSAEHNSLIIKESDLNAAATRVRGRSKWSSCQSRAATLLVGVREGGDPFWVMHHPTIHPGFGKTFSRFLPLYARNFQAELRRWNAELPYGDVLATNVDGSRFNGNVHPPITSLEIGMPGGNHRRRTGSVIPISDLVVRAQRERLELLESGGRRRLVICDVEFQTRGRSAVFELLNCFQPTGPIRLRALLEAINRRWVEAAAPRTSAPRVSYCGRVFLQRMQWLLPQRLVKTAHKVSPAEYFRELVAWRKETDMPLRAFFRVPTGEGQQRRRYRKPQYMSFDDPVSCELLRAAASRSDSVLLEEMYPLPQQLPVSRKGQHPAEISVSWYTR